MASPRISTLKGFTLIEILIVIGLLVIVGGLGLVVSFDSYRGTNFREERDIMVSVLQKARSQGINNMCFGAGCVGGKAHGVYFGTHGAYIIFQGNTYASRDAAVDEVITAKDATASVGGGTEISFAPLTGDASATTTFTVTNHTGHTSVITVEPEGRIWWTN